MKNDTSTPPNRTLPTLAAIAALVVGALLAAATVPAAAVPTKGAFDIEVRLRGATGTEMAILRVGDLELFSGEISSEWMSIAAPLSTLASGTIELAFTNDAVTSKGDRSIEVDYLSIDGALTSADSPFVYSEGAFSGVSGCSPGFVQTKILACGGKFVFGDLDGSGALVPPTDPHGNQRGLPLNGEGDIDVIARGHFGGERFEVRIGDTLVGEASTTRFWRTYRFDLDPALEGELTVVFISDFVSDGTALAAVDANLDIDFVQIGGGTELQAEDFWSSGHFVEGVGCIEGNSGSQTLHCNGEFVFGPIAATTPPE